MSRYQSIENGLKEINETVFQELCDKFLVLRNENYAAFSRTGSQSGKQKTVRGTPDSFFLLPNGNYLYIEVTTNVSDKNKLANDIQACFDPEKAKIPVDKIQEIILCFNFNIDQEQVEGLNEVARGFRSDVKVSYWSLDALAMELHLQHRDLVHEYLRLPLDTGQIVSIETFVSEYRRAAQAIATPLDNEFVHREREKEDLKQALVTTDFIILTGAPGVGKTKLAIETIKEFLNENNGYQAYCVSYKNHALLDDLYQYLQKEKDYILFVDDANRIDAFNQITGFYKAQRTGQLKIVITVRDYAFQEVDRQCQEFNPKSISIVKLTDEQIVDIVKAKPFEVLNAEYQKEIIRIADGNPRLALMAARLALEKQSLDVLYDVSDLFNKYFLTFIRDKDELAEVTNIKCLGIIAFFHTIPYKDKTVTDPILATFGIDYGSFADAIDQLDKLELVEVQYEHVKIAEQNLAVFFFYKAFVKDSYLSFQVLLDKYFDKNQHRFRECVIPANNTFGYLNVKGRLRPELQKHWGAIKSDTERSYKFLKIFWFYLQSETLAFLDEEINSLSIADEKVVYEVTYETNQFSYGTNRIIDLLGNFFRYPNNLKDALELSFAFVRKLPEHLPEVIHKIRETLTFDREDERYRFVRQTTLFDLLIKGVEANDNLFQAAFYELAKTFLHFSYHQSSGVRKNTFSWYNYPVPNTESIKEFRAKVWQVTDSHFTESPDQSFGLLRSYMEPIPEVRKDIATFDAPFILTIINNHLSSDSLQHCQYVHKQISWWNKVGVSDSAFPELQSKFTSPLYSMFLKMSWDRLRGREEYEFSNFEEYNKLKEADIRSSFVFNNADDLPPFYQKLLHVEEARRQGSRYDSLDFIVDENCDRNFSVGFQLLELIIDKDNKVNYVPWVVFRHQLTTREVADKIWRLLESRSFARKTSWYLSFFYNLDKSLVSKKYADSIVQMVNESKENILINLDMLAKFLEVDQELFQNILRATFVKNKEGRIRISIWGKSFIDHYDELGDDLHLIQETYLQQSLMDHHFDYEGEGFTMILQQNSNFLIKYFETLYGRSNRIGLSDDHLNRGFVWQIDEIEQQVAQVLDIVVQNELCLGTSEHLCDSFFRNLQEAEEKRSNIFLLNYITANSTNHQRIDFIIGIVRRSRKELFESVVLHYLSLNQDVKAFAEIWWRGNGTSGTGDVILSDIEAADWRNILSIIEKSDMGIKLLPIKQYVNQRIESCLGSAERERQWRFLEGE